MRSRPAAAADDETVDYYKLLEIPHSATPSDIKKAYRKLALKYHPDKNPDNKEAAEKRFKKIAEAYEVLSDDDKKRTYDQFGKQGIFKGNNSHNSSYTSSFHTSSSSRRNTRHHMFTEPNDIFSQFFGDSDPFANFFNTAAGHRSSRPKTAFEGMHDNFHSAFEDFDIFFNMAGNRSERSGSSSTADSSGYGGSSAAEDSDYTDSSSSTSSTPSEDTNNDEDDNIFTNLHDKLFNDMHAQNIHSNIWTNSGIFSHTPNFHKSWYTLRLPGFMFNRQSPRNSRPSNQNRKSFRPSNVKSTTTSTKFVNGKTIVTKKVVEDGMETLTTEEDGFVTSQIITYL